MKIIYTPGVWDIVHLGHLNLLKQAKNYGDYLVVGVCSDNLAKIHNKNTTMNELDRAKIILTLKYVNHTCVYNNPDQTDIIKLFKVDVFVIGEEFGNQGVPEHQNALNYCAQNNIEVVKILRTPGVSSSEIKEIVNSKKSQIIENFWKNRGNQLKKGNVGILQSTSLTLDENAAQNRKITDLDFILKAINKSTQPKDFLLDIGCGIGRITLELANIYQKIYAIDYVQDFIDIANKNSKDNIKFYCAKASEFDSSISYNLCLMSGLLPYITDEELKKILNAISYIPEIILKESVGTNCRYELSDNHFSEQLNSNLLPKNNSLLSILT